MPRLTEVKPSRTASFIAKVISDGRITIPREIRELLDIKDDSFITCNVQVYHTQEIEGAEVSAEIPQLNVMNKLLKLCASGADKEQLLQLSGLAKTRLTSYLDFLVAEKLLKVTKRKSEEGELEVFETTKNGLILFSSVGG